MRLYKTELFKLFYNKIFKIGILVVTGLILLYFCFAEVGGEIATVDGKFYSGYEAVQINRKITKEFEGDLTDEKVNQYLEGIYNTVIVKDIEERQARKEKDAGKRKITDIALLKTIASYLASVIGSPISMKSVTDYLISSGRKISPNTVSDYVEALTESFVFYPAERFDIVGKQLLKANKKLYMVDLGLRNHILPRKRYDLGFSIENIVYFELLRRGYKVNIGKFGSTEVDFVAQKQGILTYYQVTRFCIIPCAVFRKVR